MSEIALNVAMKTNELSYIRPTTGTRVNPHTVCSLFFGILEETDVTQMSLILRVDLGNCMVFFYKAAWKNDMKMSSIYALTLSLTTLFFGGAEMGSRRGTAELI